MSVYFLIFVSLKRIEVVNSSPILVLTVDIGNGHGKVSRKPIFARRGRLYTQMESHNETIEELKKSITLLNERLDAFERYFRELIDLSKPQPEHVDVSGAAALLHLAKGSVYQAIHAGGPLAKLARKRGNKLYFNRSELIKWIDAGRIDRLK